MHDSAGWAAAGSAGKDALAGLEIHRGEAYIIGHDEKRGWWAARRDRIGRFFTAPGPDELRDLPLNKHPHKAQGRR
jgi:hypothetical protein